jgi:hypothetical protein
MRILFDHGAPRGLATLLTGHVVTAAKDMGWDRLSNGNLLQAAEEAGFEMLLTTDQNIRYQQNISGRTIAILVLSGSSKWSRVRPHAERIASSVEVATQGSYAEVYIPFD